MQATPSPRPNNARAARAIDPPGAVYETGHITLDIDLTTGGNPKVWRTHLGQYVCNLRATDGVLFGNYLPQQPSILLRFQPSLQPRSVGARVSGGTTVSGLPYWACCKVKLSGDNTRLYPVPDRKSALTADGSGPLAPFMGATADQGQTIEAVWFDLLQVSGAPTLGQFTTVAIGNLYYAL